MNNWYARFPVLCADDVYFVAGNDLFTVNKNGGVPQLCMQTRNEIKYLYSYKHLIACTAYEDGGPDIYLFNTQTKEMQRITFFEKNSKVTYIDDEYLYFISDKETALYPDKFLYRYCFKTKIIENLHIGPINAYAKHKKHAIYQKHGNWYTNWKGNKGGAVGTLYKDNAKLIDLAGNCLMPCVFEDKIFFLHDDKKHGNLYSCDINGKNLTQHTNYEDFYLQDLTMQNNELIYSKGGEIFIYNAQTDKNMQIALTGHLTHPDSRNFIVNNKQYLTAFETDGKNVTAAIRGKVFECKILSGGAKELTNGLRFRVCGFLNDGTTFAFKDAPDSALFIYKNGKEIKKFALNTGKITFYKTASKGDFIAYINHRHELHIVNYKTGDDEILFSAKDTLNECDWSCDGTWLVYSATKNAYQSYIRIYNVKTKQHHNLTEPEYYDCSPTFDKNGEYIAFLSNRNISCKQDALKFDLAFQKTQKPYLISLQQNKNLLMPWNAKDADDDENDDKKKKKKEIKVEIDFENIQERIVPLPVKETYYEEIHAAQDSKLLLITNDEGENHLSVEQFCFKTMAKDELYKDIVYFNLSTDAKHCIIENSDGKIRILKTGEKGEKNHYKNDGIFELNRIRCTVEPKQEWEQMMKEMLWIIQEFYWSEKLAGLNWNEIKTKYENYSQKIRTRQELDDLINELQGEVGTSHAFILNQHYKKQTIKCGKLGAMLEYDKKEKLYQIKEILPANLQENIVSPLTAANASIKTGEYIFSIDGVALNKNYSPYEALTNKAKMWVTLEVGSKKKKRNVELQTLNSDTELLNNNWVKKNREYVAKKTDSKVGYIYVSDMSEQGFKNFFQGYLNEYDKHAIIIDMRNNGGGNISCLLLDQLQRQRIGFDNSRWHGVIEMPYQSSKGNYIVLTNEMTGSDAEIFSHQFKAMKLGKIIGQRTWGGVVGIMPRYHLIDNTLTSQPEFSMWFEKEGYKIENNGVSPDITISNDHTKEFNQENDMQLQTAITEALKLPENELEKMLHKDAHPKRFE